MNKILAFGLLGRAEQADGSGGSSTCPTLEDHVTRIRRCTTHPGDMHRDSQVINSIGGLAGAHVLALLAPTCCSVTQEQVLQLPMQMRTAYAIRLCTHSTCWPLMDPTYWSVNSTAFLNGADVMTYVD